MIKLLKLLKVTPIILMLVFAVYFIFTNTYSELILTLSFFALFIYIRSWRFHHNIAFVLSMIIMIPAFILASFGLLELADKIFMWAYVFMVLGIISYFWELNFNSKNLVSWWILFHQLKSKKTYRKVVNFCQELIQICYDLIYQVFTRIFALRPKTIGDYFLNFLKVIFFTLILIFVGIKTLEYYKSYKNAVHLRELIRDRKKLNPSIVKTEPTIVYRSTKVIIHGSSFGWNPKINKIRLMSDYGEISYDLWTDSKIIFSIPLEWRDGKHSIWIEKPISWENEIVHTSSQKIVMEVIPTTSSFTTLDDMFFSQLKTMSDEALRINGYSPQTK